MSEPHLHLQMTHANRVYLAHPQGASAALGLHSADRSVASWNCNAVMPAPNPVCD
jgi:hypothetical protein